MEKSLINKLESFGGFVSYLEEKNNDVVLKLNTWCYSDSEKPIIKIIAQNFTTNSPDNLTLESIYNNECEIFEIEYLEEKLLIWVDHFETPVELMADKFIMELVPYSHSQYKRYIRTLTEHLNSERHNHIKLRKKLRDIQIFVQQKLQRNQTKFDNHNKGSLGNRVLQYQTKLLNRILNKLRD